MRIQHNIMAMNAYRNYTNNTSALSKNLEKLSSGYKINRAGDDAAGLAISEKMRAQITGLETAQSNAKNGISLVQTAEGALTEVHDMLNRMVKLADQSANGTYDNATDRANLQKEVAALQSEIDRIADSSNFNGIKLLDGSLAKSSVSYADGSITGFPGLGATIGTNTVVHKDGVAEVRPTFTIDFSDLKGLSAATATSNRLNITISGKTYYMGKNGSIGTTATGGTDFAVGDELTINSTALNNLVTEINKTATDIVVSGTTHYAGIKVDGVAYTAKVDGNKLVFEMSKTQVTSGGTASAITAADKQQKVKDTTPNADVTVAQTGTAGIVGSLNHGHLDITSGVKAVDKVLANTRFDLTQAQMADGNKLTIGDKTYVFKDGADSTTTANAANGEVLVDLSTIHETSAAAKLLASLGKLTDAAADNGMYTVGVDGTSGRITLQEKGTYTGDADLATLDGIKDTVSLSEKQAATADRSLMLLIGDSADAFNQLKVGVQDMHVAALGVDLANVDISTQAGATSAVDKIKAAINTVSSVRGDLGATQNRLEHTINNLAVMTENIQDAEASIRDVDVAEEMMSYTKNNILVQSAQAMLAQANQVPQGVLQLLQ